MKVGDDAVFTFPALKPDTSGTAGTAPVTGKITAIAQTATTTNNVVSYPVTVSITNPPAGLRLGQSANISVTTATAKPGAGGAHAGHHHHGHPAERHGDQGRDVRRR